jgi:S-adenosylmethionine:tRNA ribosyltransferase-isomerase
VIAASRPLQRPPDAKLLVVDRCGRIRHAPRRELVELLRPGDLVIANDAATLPASLRGRHLPTGAEVEVRLAGMRSLAPADVGRFSAVVFGAGDFSTRTEERPAPPPLAPGDRLELGPLHATVERVSGHRPGVTGELQQLRPSCEPGQSAEQVQAGMPGQAGRLGQLRQPLAAVGPTRLVTLRFDGPPDAIWEGLARHGRPIQYAHVPAPLALWDVWTPIAGRPLSFEPPSAGFALDWQLLGEMRAHGVAFGTLTLAAGISSTGDAELDLRLPLDEPYAIPAATARAIADAQARRGRVIAVGTTVVRAAEHAAERDGRVRAGQGVATQRLGPQTRLRVVDAILTGTHAPETSHYQLLRAFVDDLTLRRADRELEAGGYRTHEFGDSVLIEKQAPPGGCRLRQAQGADGRGVMPPAPPPP